MTSHATRLFGSPTSWQKRKAQQKAGSRMDMNYAPILFCVHVALDANAATIEQATREAMAAYDFKPRQGMKLLVKLNTNKDLKYKRGTNYDHVFNAVASATGCEIERTVPSMVGIDALTLTATEAA